MKKIIGLSILAISSLVFITGCSLTQAISSKGSNEVILTGAAKEANEYANKSVDPERMITNFEEEVENIMID